MKQTPTKKKPIRIFYVGNFHPLSVGEPEIANALESLGHKVTRHPNDKPLNNIDFKQYDFMLFFVTTINKP